MLELPAGHPVHSEFQRGIVKEVDVYAGVHCDVGHAGWVASS